MEVTVNTNKHYPSFRLWLVSEGLPQESNIKHQSAYSLGRHHYCDYSADETGLQMFTPRIGDKRLSDCMWEKLMNCVTLSSVRRLAGKAELSDEIKTYSN